MSQFQDQKSQPQERAASPGDVRKDHAEGQDLRFTPLRSYVKARTLTQDAGSELALSRLEPITRL